MGKKKELRSARAHNVAGLRFQLEDNILNEREKSLMVSSTGRPFMMPASEKTILNRSSKS